MKKSLEVQVGSGHYKDMAIQPVEYITKNNMGFIEGSIIKYVSRYKTKNGVEDLKKARHFLDMLIENQESEEFLKSSKMDTSKLTFSFDAKKVRVRPSRAKASAVKTSKTVSDFMKPLQPSTALEVVVGNDKITRTEAIKRIWDYIKKNNCQNPRNKRSILADEKLKPIFGKDEVTMFELATILGKHLT